MVDTKEIIRVLGFIQEYFDNHADEQEPDYRKEMFRDWSEITFDAITLLKAQEPEALDAPKPDSDIGCWYDITHNYTLEQVVNALKAQEPHVISREEWDNWRHTPDGKREPLYVQHSTGEWWILNPSNWLEIAFLTGEVKIWDKKPTDDQRRVLHGIKLMRTNEKGANKE